MCRTEITHIGNTFRGANLRSLISGTNLLCTTEIANVGHEFCSAQLSSLISAENTARHFKKHF